MKLTGENRQLGDKPVPVTLCPPQISHGLTRDRTRASAVRGRQYRCCMCLNQYNMVEKNIYISSSAIGSLNRKEKQMNKQKCLENMYVKHVFKRLSRTRRQEYWSNHDRQYNTYASHIKLMNSSNNLSTEVLPTYAAPNCTLARERIRNSILETQLRRPDFDSRQWRLTIFLEQDVNNHSWHPWLCNKLLFSELN
jgi:hypothetical protein